MVCRLLSRQPTSRPLLLPAPTRAPLSAPRASEPAVTNRTTYFGGCLEYVWLSATRATLGEDGTQQVVGVEAEAGRGTLCCC